ncbi:MULTISPECIES: single-stranded-DNA-specific exonuclease RecJ [unclassified Moraxella]|uniref:single-stranded-DNA-specific exonuclease RecJ n=1 Tax=unclassified Moraxella TaxID=2685852 RepID=UPI003AF49999
MLTITPRYQKLLASTQPNSNVTHASFNEALSSASAKFGLSETLTRILLGRGIHDAQQLSTSFGVMLSADGLLGLDSAVSLLDQALDKGDKILIVGDFDCDGATSTALMVRVLRAMGGQVEFLVPDRFKYGYGLTPEIVQLGIELFAPQLIVTVDNGISSHAGVAFAKQHGLQVIITDHHLTNHANPPADAVVNPNQLGCTFGSKALVGVGVAFYVLGNLAKSRRNAGKSTTQVSQYLDLVALGTVADVGVLDQNNRILVHHGLQAIRAGRCCVGILAILEQAGKQAEQITVQDFGFIIAPRINAAGRMDNMRIGIECLLSDDWGEAGRLAYQLDKLNQERRQTETQMRQQANDILQNTTPIPANLPLKRSVVLYQDDWHQGVIGIVSGRLKETYHLPSIVFAPADTTATKATDSIKGSARSIEGIHIRDMIEAVAQANPQLISHFGGHAMAAGLTLQRQHFEAFCQAFETALATLDESVFEQTLFSDGQLAGAEYSLNFVEALNELAIWGNGFAPPIFDEVFVVQDVRVLKDKHLKLWLSHPQVAFTLEAIWFNADLEAVNISQINRSISQIHVLFELQKNTFNEQQSLQLLVKKAVLI